MPVHSCREASCPGEQLPKQPLPVPDATTVSSCDMTQTRTNTCHLEAAEVLPCSSNHLRWGHARRSRDEVVERVQLLLAYVSHLYWTANTNTKLTQTSSIQLETLHADPSG